MTLDNENKSDFVEITNQTKEMDNQTTSQTNMTNSLINPNIADSVMVPDINNTKTSDIAAIDPALTMPSGAATPSNPSYSPDPLNTLQGKIITIVNDDSAPHTVTSG